MNSSQTLFLMHIMDGYSFRNMIGIIKSETEFATMVVSERNIEISFLNTARCAVHKITLHPQEFTAYCYNIRDQEGNLFPEYPITFETNEMFNTTKGIGRRDGIRLYWLLDDTKINVQPFKMSTKDPGRAGALFVKIQNMEHVRYETAGAYSLDPNVRVQAKDFADLCSQASTMKCASLEIIGHRNGVTFKGFFSSQVMAFINKFVSQTEVPRNGAAPISNIDEIDNLLDNLRISDCHPAAPVGLSLNIVKSEDLMTVKVPIATVKALSKIHNISPAGTLLRFHFAEGRPTKLESPIGTYGLYVICLRNGRV
jgi:hypothetical protein